MALSRSEALGQAIRQIRKQRKLTQENASMDSGMDRAYLGQIERATKDVKLTTAWRIADMLGVKLSEIVVLAEKLEEEGRD